MKLRSTLTPEMYEQMAACVHEAGHGIVARVLGHSVSGVTLTLTADASPQAVCEVVQRFGGRPDPAVAYAGPWAEEFWRNNGVPTSAGIRRSLARNANDAAMITASGEPAPLSVPRLLVDCWESVRHLAGTLYVNLTATQDDIDTALRIPLDADEPTKNHALALIRSGSVPGTFKVSPVGTRV